MTGSDARQVRYSREASRTLNRIDRRTARRIRDKLAVLATHPDALANNVSAPERRSRLDAAEIGGWRVIYTDDLAVLLVLKVAPRGSAYD